MLISIEQDRLKQGKPVSVVAIAHAWADRRIEMGLASYLEVQKLTEKMARELQQAVRSGKLDLYDTTLEKERPYRATDEEELVGGYAQLLPKSVDAWLDDEGWRPTLATPCIQPPHGWTAQSLYGLQRFDDSDAGRLVRLADLVQWLMDTREMACKTAVERICETLEQNPSAAAGWLYLLTENDNAHPLPAEHSFFYVPAYDPNEPYPTGQAEDKGLTGAIKHMRRYWGESSSPDAGNWSGQHVLGPLAIRLDVAHLLFDYGRRVDPADQHQQAAAPAVPTEPVGKAPAEQRRVFKKMALVQELKGEWPTIERDLSEASRNGLNAAKAERHGNWDVQKAREWAESKGKLGKSADVQTLPPVWLGPVTRHRPR